MNLYHDKLKSRRIFKNILAPLMAVILFTACRSTNMTFNGYHSNTSIKKRDDSISKVNKIQSKVSPDIKHKLTSKNTYIEEKTVLTTQSINGRISTKIKTNKPIILEVKNSARIKENFKIKAPKPNIQINDKNEDLLQKRKVNKAALIGFLLSMGQIVIFYPLLILGSVNLAGLLITSVAVSIIGLILGIIGIIKVNKYPEKYKGLGYGIWAVIVSGVIFSFWLLVFIAFLNF